jgi:hypothetical protein
MPQYDDSGFMSYVIDAKNGPSLLANFTARIVKETHYIGGVSSETIFTITGQQPSRTPGSRDPLELPEIQVSSTEFPQLAWVMQKWGSRCVIAPGGVKDDLRVMIQLRSQAEVETVYRELGWQDTEDGKVFVHNAGAITRKGNDESYAAELPIELQRYDLSTDVPHADGVRASLALLDICNRNITWPFLAATLAPVYGPVDFAVHLTGRTGSFKSELVSLFQSHYGPNMDARNLPCSWSSTASAMEALCFLAKNCLIAVDDFVPQGTSYNVKALQQTADRIIRAQGNQAGRARLTDISSMQTTMYPRGEIMSTGEDTPEGHSVRARMLIREIAAGEIDADNLTIAQNMRPLYSATVAWLCQSLANVPASLKVKRDTIRSEQRAVGHSRTPGMLGHLISVAQDFLDRARQADFITEAERVVYAKEAERCILEAGAQQAVYLEDADPVDQFFAAIRQVLASGGGHMRTQNGGIPKQKTDLLGWTVENAKYEMPTYKSRGPCIGWVNWAKNSFWLDVTAGYPVLAKAMGKDMQLSKNTLFKRLKDAGALKQVDDARSRNTIRITADGHPRLVLALELTRVLEVEDLTDEEGTHDGDSGSSGGESEDTEAA